ncbi:TIGR02444 family protein [Pseudoalteromonas sp. SSM20]|uniref:TIGR02444 family protein n=1 Tax=Pseudoalteromonas sp. SSM20 TaxID=3139394 RepID=UPI003BA95593
MQRNLQTDLLWQFSLDYYSKSTHSSVLLTLQDKHGANINLCLLLIYLKEHKLPIDSSQIDALHTEVSYFNTTYTSQLRQTRSLFKQTLQDLPNYSALRSHLLNAELELEKHEQQILISTYNKAKQQKSDAALALQYYLSNTLHVSKTDLDQTLIQLA